MSFIKYRDTISDILIVSIRKRPRWDSRLIRGIILVVKLMNTIDFITIVSI